MIVRLVTLLFLLALASCQPAFAQGAGCGPQNPNCIVPTAPPGTNNDQAASTAFVQAAVAGGGLPALPSGQIWIGSISNVATAQTLSGSGDCSLSLANNGAVTLTCTKTGGVSFGPLATQATPCTAAQGCTGANNATNATGDLLVSNGVNGNYVTKGLNALCTLVPTLCSKALGYTSIAWYGAVCDGSTDDTTAIQNAWNAGQTANTDTWLGGVGNVCVISSLTMPTPVALPSGSGWARVSNLVGPGSNLVRLKSTVTGTTCAISMTATYGTNSSLTGQMTGFGLVQNTNGGVGKGFCLTNITFANFSEVAVTGFAPAVSATDCILLNFDRMWIELNVGGIIAVYSVNSPPNGFNITNSRFGSNTGNVLQFSGSTTAGAKNVRIAGNSFQSNGTAGSSSTIFVQGDPGSFGGGGVDIIANYFEADVGAAEIQFTQASNASLIGVHNVMYNNFIRSSSNLSAGILINNNGTGSPFTVVNIGGNGFNDTLATGPSYQWIAAVTPATTNYQFGCTIPNLPSLSTEINSRCGKVAASKTLTSDANAQWIGFN